ncbi:MAG: EamA family transporter [Candidatus Parcubacteria bacterium]|nr:EamA family transporter [Burkholderiales bacterium]
MSTLTFCYIAAAVLLGSAAQLLLKAGTNATPVGLGLALEPRILAGAACYAVSLVVWVLALSKAPVSVAYPMVSLGFALNALLAWWLLGEAVTPLRMAGIGVIIVGVILVARS